MKSHLIIFTVLVSSLSMTFVHGQGNTLDSVPMQGGMAMPAIKYNAELGQLLISMPDTTPQLIPLEISHPGDQFDPSSPWFDSLDPSRKGMAFNRQYGFIMDATSDFLPDGAGIWIRQLYAPSALKAYNYRSHGSDTKSWKPIFGTSGSSDVLEWNLMMFHPAFAAPRGSGPLMAFYEAFVVNLDTGMPMEEIGSVTFALRWSSATSGGEPALTISNKVVLAWKGEFAGFVLESSDSLDNPVWEETDMTPTMMNGEYVVLVEAAAPAKFYRLRQPQAQQ